MRCSHSVHPGNASNIRTTARIGCPTATLSPPPNVKESGSSRGRMRVDFIHSHHHTSSQYQRNKKKHRRSGRLALMPVEMRYLWWCPNLLIKNLHCVFFKVVKTDIGRYNEWPFRITSASCVSSLAHEIHSGFASKAEALSQTPNCTAQWHPLPLLTSCVWHMRLQDWWEAEALCPRKGHL